jgi:hypothetical protein
MNENRIEKDGNRIGQDQSGTGTHNIAWNTGLGKT